MVPLSRHKGSTQPFGIALSLEKAFQALLTAISLCWRPVGSGTEKKCLERKQNACLLLDTKPCIPSWHTKWCR